ncbi:MAG: zinc-ribbon domain-containing protein [Acidobacteria bacterium]|nr:zinc-ribbon domain-containing protein [Acidobacteriota bacterium]
MRVECPQCHKAYMIPEEKLPAAPSAFACTACGGKVVVQPPASRPAAPRPVPPPDSEAGQTAAPIPPNQMEALRREVTKEIMKSLGLNSGLSEDKEQEEEESQLALVCEDEELFQNVISDALTKLRYRCDVAQSTKASLERLAAVPYNMVTVDSRFPDDPEGGYKILQAINALPPERRRKMFVAFISADLSTMDLNSAFILGANVTIGKKDIKRLDKILSDGFKEHQQRYRVFLRVEEEVNNEKL